MDFGPVPPYDLVHISTCSNPSFPPCLWLMAKEGHQTRVVKADFLKAVKRLLRKAVKRLLKGCYT